MRNWPVLPLWGHATEKNLKVYENDLYSDLFKIPGGLRNQSLFTLVKFIIVSRLSVFDKTMHLWSRGIWKGEYFIVLKRKLKLNENTGQHFPVADLRVGNNSKSWGTNQLFSQYFPAICMKMKEIGPGPHIPASPLPSVRHCFLGWPWSFSNRLLDVLFCISWPFPRTIRSQWN